MAGYLFDTLKMGLTPTPETKVEPTAPSGHGAGIVLSARERILLTQTLNIHPSKLAELCSDSDNLDEVNRLVEVAEKLAPPEPSRSHAHDGLLFEHGRYPGLERRERPKGWFRAVGGIYSTHDGAPMIVTPDAAAQGDSIPQWWAEQHPTKVPAT